MWNKPKTWGGYDTSKGKFYLANKDGTIVAWETDNDWQVAYNQWVSGTNKNFYLLGLKF